MGEPGFQLRGDAPQRYDEHVAPIMAPFVTAAIDAAGIGPGGRVLDLACGTGFVARAAAARVGPTGRVAGVDLNAAMLAVARRRATGLPAPVSWHEASADDLPFGGGTFDAAVCQQGFQFFSDVDGVAAELARVLRPGGRLVVTVWSDLDRCPYFAAQAEAVTAVAGSDIAAVQPDGVAAAAARVAAALRAGESTGGGDDDVTLPFRTTVVAATR